MTSWISLFEIVLCEWFGNTAEACEVLPGVWVNLLALNNGHNAKVGTGTMRKAVAASGTEVVRSMHNLDLPCIKATSSSSFLVRFLRTHLKI